MSDGCIELLTIKDADLIVHWDLGSKVMFGNRFGCMLENFPQRIVEVKKAYFLLLLENVVGANAIFAVHVT